MLIIKSTCYTKIFLQVIINMNQKNKCIHPFLILTLFISIICACSVKATETTSSTVNSTVQGKIKDNDLSESDLRLIEEWNITRAEWLRYKKIITGPWGAMNENLVHDVIAVLGVNAQSDDERKRYAKIYVENQWKDISKIQAFDRERVLVARDMSKNIDVVNQELLPNVDSLMNRSESLKSGDKISFFLHKNDMELNKEKSPYSKTLENILNIIKYRKDIRLDIFFVGISDDNIIKKWAMSRNIDPEIVKQGRITLNPTPKSVFRSLDLENNRWYIMRGDEWFHLKTSLLF